MDPVEELLAKERVREVVTRLFVSTDEKDWDQVRACFFDQVLFDMESLTGEKPIKLPADQIVEKALDILFSLTDLLDERAEQQGWSFLSEPALQRVWDNEEDAMC